MFIQQKQKVLISRLFSTLSPKNGSWGTRSVNQILTNILSNAIKFTSEGGSVKLIITQPDADTSSSHIRFEISDTGIGMSKEYLQRMFTPFEQADASISRRFGGSEL